jgi:hypothetical protein
MQRHCETWVGDGSVGIAPKALSNAPTTTCVGRSVTAGAATDAAIQKHTRHGCGTRRRHMIEAVPETIPAPPENGRDRAVKS